jgi:3-oxoadipate enol-lactonase
MPFVDLHGDRFHYRLDGARQAPVLVLSNSLGTTLDMWQPQVEAFGRRFRLLRYDTRGHGTSLVTPGLYTIAQLGGDVIALLDALDINRAHFCGLSMGGATGMWLATYAAQRFEKIVLCNTSARIGTLEFWATRIATLRQGGLEPVAPGFMERWFSAPFRARDPQTVATMRKMLISTPLDGYIACCEALRDNDQRESISAVRLPTLVIGGAQDVATPPADGRFIAERIPGARYVEFDTAHLSNMEVPEKFSDAVLKFLIG